MVPGDSFDSLRRPQKPSNTYKYTISVTLPLVKRISTVYSLAYSKVKPYIALFNGCGAWLTLFVLITDTLRSQNHLKSHDNYMASHTDRQHIQRVLMGSTEAV